MAIHAADDRHWRNGTAKGLHLAPSEVFELGDRVYEVYADRASDLRWSGHVSIFGRGSRKRLDRFTVSGSHETFGLLLAAARVAVESRTASERSKSLT